MFTSKIAELYNAGMARKSKARTQIDWDPIFEGIEKGHFVDIPIAPHLTIFTMGDKLLEVAKVRGVDVDYSNAAGHLMAWKKVDDPFEKALKLVVNYKPKK